ncbi:MAG: PIN domain-containing protein [Nitrospira sp.]|nr:PIN domain-containing protein [Nitrospira sp.]
MMLYLDTRALVKLYVDEPLSQELSAAVDESEAVATSLLAYAEAMMAFARARRDAKLSLLMGIVTSWMRSKRIGPAL